ncbi:MAG: DUF4252 domain-containing protein [Bacteroidales bacterium]|nr:DUF4252 domain-containing protein [Bacteroidales bacterium]
MKRFITIIILISTIIFSANAQNALYKKYEKSNSVTRVYISQMMLELTKSANLQMDDDVSDIIDSFDSVTGFYLLETEDPTLMPDLKKDFMKEVNAKKLELLMEVNDDDRVLFYARKEGNYFADVYMIVEDENDEIVVIMVSGKLSQQNINRLLNNVD